MATPSPQCADPVPPPTNVKLVVQPLMPSNLYFLHYMTVTLHVSCIAVAEQHNAGDKTRPYTTSFPTFSSPSPVTAAGS